MPGFMGLRGLEKKNPHDMERERRRQEQRRDTQMMGEKERRSREKVQEILQNQGGDMSAFNQVVSGETRTPVADVAMLPVERLMSGRVAVLSFDDTLLTAQGIFANVRFHHLPVVDDDGCLIGIVSDRDVLRLTSPFFGTINEQNRDAESMDRKVGTVMTRHPVTVDLGTRVEQAIRTMGRKKIGCLPVMEPDTGRLMGIITWKDIVRAYCPAAFRGTDESTRLKTGVAINSESSESQRLRSRAAESARLRPAESARLRPPPGDQTAPPSRRERPRYAGGSHTTALHPKAAAPQPDQPPFDPDRADAAH